MVTTLVRFTVKDFAVWKKGFDGAVAMRREGGETSARVFTSETNPNEVFLFNTWESLEKLDGFMNNPELSKRMAEDGVLEDPEQWRLIEQ